MRRYQSLECEIVGVIAAVAAENDDGGDSNGLQAALQTVSQVHRASSHGQVQVSLQT